jgi:hypothetical protein
MQILQVIETLGFLANHQMNHSKESVDKGFDLKHTLYVSATVAEFLRYLVFLRTLVLVVCCIAHLPIQPRMTPLKLSALLVLR